MPNRKYTKELLESAVKKNYSIAGVMRSLGIKSISGGLHHHLKNKIKSFSINTNHFLGQGSNRGKDHKGGPRRRTTKEILVKKTCGLREKVVVLRRSLSESGIKMVCKECGVEGIWNNKKLVLEVNHRNGNFLDNRLENLEYLCPNCHSQFPNLRNKPL